LQSREFHSSAIDCVWFQIKHPRFQLYPKNYINADNKTKKVPKGFVANMQKLIGKMRTPKKREVLHKKNLLQVLFFNKGHLDNTKIEFKSRKTCPF